MRYTILLLLLLFFTNIFASENRVSREPKVDFSQLISLDDFQESVALGTVYGLIYINLEALLHLVNVREDRLLIDETIHYVNNLNSTYIPFLLFFYVLQTSGLYIVLPTALSLILDKAIDVFYEDFEPKDKLNKFFNSILISFIAVFFYAIRNPDKPLISLSLATGSIFGFNVFLFYGYLPTFIFGIMQGASLIIRIRTYGW